MLITIDSGEIPNQNTTRLKVNFKSKIGSIGILDFLGIYLVCIGSIGSIWIYPRINHLFFLGFRFSQHFLEHFVIGKFTLSNHLPILDEIDGVLAS